MQIYSYNTVQVSKNKEKNKMKELFDSCHYCLFRRNDDDIIILNSCGGDDCAFIEELFFQNKTL